VHDLIALPQSEFELEIIAEETAVAAAAAKAAKEHQDREDMMESVKETQAQNLEADDTILHGASSHDSEEEEVSLNETV